VLQIKQNMKPHQRIIFALDVPTYDVAQVYLDLLQDHVGMFKVGLELFIADGHRIMKLLADRGIPVMLDLKLHDIPETVSRAILRASEMGAKFVTLHVQQRDTMVAAALATERTGVQLLGVTVLTSISKTDCEDLNHKGTPLERVLYLAEFASDLGINGFVCSPQEALWVRLVCPQATIVTPGIRLADSSISDDQKRTGTPIKAIADGADYLVVGRPIRDASDPVVTAHTIAQEIELGLSIKERRQKQITKEPA
jgi:orotidine-5'-phosphate decarboxylase